MTDPVTIARAESVQDCAALRTLVQAHIAFERNETVLPEDWEQSVVKLTRAGALTIFTAKVHADAVGYAAITTDVATWTAEVFAHLDCLFVQEEHRGAQIGRQLVEAAIAEAARRGCREVQWQTPSWNSAAIRFYERLGATSAPKARFRLAIRADRLACRDPTIGRN